MERNERRDYLHAINDIAQRLGDESLKAVYETALICDANERKIKAKKGRDDYALH